MPVLFRGLAAALALLPAATAQTAGNSPQECKARLQYFQSLTAQAKTPDLKLVEDPVFPANLTSIGKGGNCGDPAANNNEPCSKFDNWGKFQAIAAAKKLTFAVIPPEPVGIRYGDIHQGSLGDCYFMSALASLAYAVPQLIEAMFVKRELWAKDVYTTKWSLNGAQVLVAVNNDIPVYKEWLETWFATPQKENPYLVFWPTIAEKAWGKIYQSFKATTGGDWAQVIASVTAATVQTMYIGQADPTTPDMVWEFIQKGTTMKFPMAAGTCGNASKYGMATRHQYAVFRAYTLESGAKAVEVYNPWGLEFYNGALADLNKKNGLFSMLLDEFMNAMASVQMAEVYPGYRTSSVQVTSSSSQIIGVKEFEVKTDKPFFVSVNWPSNHLWQPCRVENPEVILAVSLKDYMSKPFIGTSKGRMYGVNSDYTMIKGAGKYVAYVMARFLKDTYMDTVSLAIYASDDIDIADSTRVPRDTIKEMVEPTCDDLTITIGGSDSQGLYKRNEQSLFYGIPTYWSSDKQTVAYYRVKCAGWSFTSADQLDKVKQYWNWDLSCFKSADLGVCGAKDTGAASIAGWNVNCEDVKNKKARDFTCNNSKFTESVKRYCPETCIDMNRKEQEFLANPKSVCPPCSTITVLGKDARQDGLYVMNESMTLDLVPTYWSLNQKWVAYYRDKAACKGWSIVEANNWYYVQQGWSWPIPCYSASDLGKCGCFDTALVPIGVYNGTRWVNPTCADLAAKRFSSVLHCGDVFVKTSCSAQCQVCASSTRLFDADAQAAEPATEQPDARFGGRAFALSHLGLMAALPLFLAAVVAGVAFMRHRARLARQPVHDSTMDLLVAA